MSRIQEALARAAKEKAKRTTTEIADLVDIAAEVMRPAAVAAAVPEVKPRVEEEPQHLHSRAFEEIERKCTHPAWSLDPHINVFAPGANGRIGAERFRTLRSRLYQIAETRTLKRVMITSSVPSEGKSFVAANLAQAIVHQQNHRVLLIDADLRKPALHNILSAPKTPGLTNYLRGDADEFAIIQKGLRSNLFFIPAGNEVGTPSELLLNARMKKLLDFVSEAFDWVVIDSPPALPVNDPGVLAGLCDGVLFVVRAGSTDVEMAVKASSEFRKKNLLGVVFNHAETVETYTHSPYYS
jgi:protein-tyrosine kinase